jgi:hypothetical protein
MARQGKTASRVARAKKAQPAVRRPRPRADFKAPVRKPDIPLEVLDRTYSPKQTSLKGPFRTRGDDHQRDQELAEGYVEERWSDEDRFTNKSGDPRIGTHHRKYEPEE